jgi:hypothetical protein
VSERIWVDPIGHHHLEIGGPQLAGSRLSQKLIDSIPPPRVFLPERRENAVGQSLELAHLPGAPTGLVPLAGRRIAARDGLDDRPPVWSGPQRVGRSPQGAFGIAGKELRYGQEIDQTGFCGSYGLNLSPRRKGVTASEARPLNRYATPSEKWPSAKLGLSSIALSAARTACSSLLEKLHLLANAKWAYGFFGSR